MKKTRTKKAKKETISVEILNYALGEIYKRLEGLEKDVRIQKDRNMGIIRLVPEDFKEETPVKKIGRWKPEMNRSYFSVLADGTIVEFEWEGDKDDEYHYKSHNCHEIYIDAEDAKETELLKKEYKDFCTELNGIRHVNWENDEYKYLLYWNYESSCICIGHDTNGRSEGTTYCLDEELKYKALDKFGEEKLKVILGVD